MGRPKGSKNKSSKVVVTNKKPEKVVAEPKVENVVSVKMPEFKKFSGFDLFAQGSDLIAQTKESLVSMRARKKNIPTTTKSLKEVSRDYIPVDNFGWQLTLNSFGFQPKTVFEIIGPEGVGKSSLVFWMLGQAMKNNCPVFYLNTESKWLNEQRTRRCLSSDPELARKMYGIIQTDEIHELRSAINLIEDWVRSMRVENEVTVPKQVPLVVAVDTLSKLMAPGEALGIYNYGDCMSEANMKKLKDVGEASNLEFAKTLHAWCRRLPAWLSDNNVFLILVSHQNQKISMTPFGPALSADVIASYNKTKIGGNATNQNALTQVILKGTGQYKKSNEVIGKKIQLRVVKNSAGPDNALFEYLLKTKAFSDSENYQDMAFDFNEGAANLIIEQGLLNATLSAKKYTCKELDVIGVSAEEFMNALHSRKDIMDRISIELELSGYPSKFDIKIEKPDESKVVNEDESDDENNDSDEESEDDADLEFLEDESDDENNDSYEESEDDANLEFLEGEGEEKS